MIHFIPFSRFNYKLYRSPAEVEKQLSALVRPPMRWRKSFFSKRDEGPPFHGEVKDAGFKFRRIINYRNSYQPVITGRIVDELDSTMLSGWMHPHWLVLLLSFLFMFIMTTSFFVPYFANENVEQLKPMLLPALGMLLVFYVSIMALFNYEANKSAALLESHFGGSRDR